MESQQNTSTVKLTQNSSVVETMMELLRQSGAELDQKQGLILMPLSKKQRENMTQSNQQPSQ